MIELKIMLICFASACLQMTPQELRLFPTAQQCIAEGQRIINIGLIDVPLDGVVTSIACAPPEGMST